MESFWPAFGAALWLGILTSLSPCPLATNIAAITYIGKRVDRPSRVLWSGLVYTLGRTVAYVALGLVLVAGLLSIPELSFFLQRHMNQALGPLLIVTGLILLGVIPLNFTGSAAGEEVRRRAESWGVWGAGLLGLLFALSFCPVSAALFFGSLIPLALEQQSKVLIPTVYGVGTALPVVVFAVLAAFGAKFVGGLFNRLTQLERWARVLTAIVFLIVGVYYCLTYLLGIQIL
jgi:cytochrome c-type biogenesis protein